MDDVNSLFAILAQQNGWIWLIAAAVLFVLEIGVPGIFFLWFGLAAVAVGGLLFVVPISGAWQIALFSILSLISLYIGRAVMGSQRPVISDSPMLNQRAHQLIGQTFVVAEAISSGRGRITAGDSLWMVKGPDAAVGEHVRVTGVDGTLLVVERA